MCQRTDKGIHALNTCIISLVNQCKFPNQSTKETLKIMVLQYAVQYHKAQDWICQQDQSQITYQALLSQCQLLESCCEMFQKAKEKDHGEVISLSALTSLVSSTHQDALLAIPKCAYCHSPTAWPMAKNAIDAAAATTSLPYAKEDHRDPLKVTAPSPQEMQAHHSDRVVTSLAAGTGPATPLDAPADGPAEPLPTVLPAAIPRAHAIPTETEKQEIHPLPSSTGQL